MRRRIIGREKRVAPGDQEEGKRKRNPKNKTGIIGRWKTKIGKTHASIYMHTDWPELRSLLMIMTSKNEGNQHRKCTMVGGWRGCSAQEEGEK